MTDVVNVKEVYKELRFIRENMVSRADFNSILETFEVLHNQDTVEQIAKSSKDLKERKTKRVRGVKDILG